VQFETGEEEFESRHPNCLSLSFPKKALEQRPKQIVEQIHGFIQSNELDEIWIEWNGVVPFSELQALLLAPALRSLCRIQKVLHIADAANIESLLGRTGGALPEQIANSDFAVVRNIRSSDTYYRVRRLLRGINPGVPVY
jgi:G3E family GTPase